MLNTSFSPWPCYSDEEAEAISKLLLSNKVNYWTGDEARQFEKEFAAFADCTFAVALANGTVALDLAFKALEIGEGHEVIVTSRTFIASVSSIVNAGATPVFADVDPDSQNISPDTIEKVITAKTKAIVCVHLAGWPCDMDAILALAGRYNLFVIEDCAQAHGAKYNGRSAGSFGHISAWSFCQDKIMTTGGEGGMVTTNDKALWAKMWSYKDHGKSWEAVYEKEHPPGFRWLHDSFGTNWRMTEIQAVLGRIQLQRMPEWHRKRRRNADKIWHFARQCAALRVPELPGHIEHAAYKCYIFVRLDRLQSGWDRDRIMAEILAHGVPVYSGSCSEVYLEQAFNDTGWCPKDGLPTAKELGKTSLMFLVHPTLTQAEIQLTCDAIEKAMEKASI